MEEREQPTYLIPANSKRSALIAGIFRPFDLGIFVSGVILTLMLLFIISDTSFLAVIIKLFPALICTFLILPIPNYHNTLCLVQDVLSFFINRRRYFWKGWCIYDDAESKK
jgi:hypothetical protein